MQLRRLETFGLVASLAAGAALTPETISGEASGMLVTFLGLVSASVLPTISLLINSMAANSRSVLAINRLEQELTAAMDALFFLFGCVAVAIAALISLSIPAHRLLTLVPFLTTEILPRAGQAIVVAPVFLIVVRLGQIPAILRRSLAVRHEMAIEEARKKLADNIPSGDKIRETFANHPDFGKAVSLNELQSRKPQ